MILLLLVIGLAIVIGYFFGGRLGAFEHFRLRLWGLVIAGLAIQLVPLPEGGAGTDLVVRTIALSVSYTLLVAFALANARLPGMPLVLIGLACNFLVIAANGGMPVSEAALVDSGQADVVPMLRVDGSDKHHLMDEDDVLTFLADVIGVPKPIGQAISVGDLFIYAGLIWVTIAAMRGRSPSSPTEQERYRGKHRRRGQDADPGSPTPDEPLPVATRSGTGP
jgi:hypothetical protein